MYISLTTIVLLAVALFFYSSWRRVSSEHSSSLRKKNQMISEAQSVVNAMKDISWVDMSEKQRELQECAAERLKLLLSYKRNHAPEYFSGLREWPLWFNVNDDINKL